MSAHTFAAATGPLSQLPLHRRATVTEVTPPEHSPEWGRLLAEIGFMPGEQVQIMARAMPGGDPLVVRVGDSTFALRRAEADCIGVRVDDPKVAS